MEALLVVLLRGEGDLPVLVLPVVGQEAFPGLVQLAGGASSGCSASTADLD